MYVLDRRKVEIDDTQTVLTVDLPDGSIPRRFINQGTKGVFLWFDNSRNPGARSYSFVIANRGEAVPTGAEYMQELKGSLKDADYKFIYRLS